MLDFIVECQGRYVIRSVVYAIDSQRDRFLIVDDDGYFTWVPTADCKLCKEDVNEWIEAIISSADVESD